MPFFSVLLEGKGLRIDLANEDAQIAGFFATRFVWAESPESAERMALDGVAREWKTEPHSSQPGGQSLSLVVAGCQAVGILRGLFNRPAGFTFFRAEA
jgi:hypothetical protein